MKIIFSDSESPLPRANKLVGLMVNDGRPALASGENGPLDCWRDAGYFSFDATRDDVLFRSRPCA